MELREPGVDDAERIRELVDSSMDASYRLSPQQIEAITEAEFSDDNLARILDDEKAVAIVAENDADGVETAVAGIVLGGVDDGVGEIRWLFVDPEHWGYGVGSALLEAAVETLRERNVGYVRATTLEKSTGGEQFLERFDFVRTDERTVELGDESLVEYVYTESAAATGATDAAKTDAGELELPRTEVEGDSRTATTEDGRTVYLDTEDADSGTDNSFFPTYTDEERTERYGYYCANCGSLEVMVDNMDRMECSECGNSHASRSERSYDDSYL